MRVALYARVSTRDKDQNPETQLQPLRDWASRQGFQAVEYVDYASGKDLQRPGWQAMIREVMAGRIDLVACLRLDRAFRSVVDLHTVLQDLEARGVRFAAITQPIDTSTAMGRFFITTLGAIAELEREMIRERVLEGLGRARREGRSLGRRKTKLPYSIEDLQRIVDEEGSIAGAAKRLNIPRSMLRRRLAENPVPPQIQDSEATG